MVVDSSNKVSSLIIFLLWPFFALILAIRNFHDTNVRFIIPLCTGFLGYTYQPRGDSDVFRSIERFESLADSSLQDISIIFLRQLTGIERGGTEVFLNLISYITHLFSGNWRVMLAIWGVIVGIILVNFYDKLYVEYSPSTKSLVTKIFFLFLIFYMPPITSINGRFWLAYWVYIYFAWQFISTKKTKYLLFAFLPVLIHQGTALAAFLLLFYSVTYKFPFSHKLYYMLIIASIIYNAIGIELIRSFGASLGGAYDGFISGYTSEEYISRINERAQISASELSRGHWFFRHRGPFLYFTLLSVLAFWRFSKRILFDKSSNDLYLFILVLIAAQIFVSDVPSVGGRYQIILLGIVLLLYTKLSIINPFLITNPSVLVLLPAMFFYFLTTMRLEFEQLYGYFFISNPILALFYIQDISFLELIR